MNKPNKYLLFTMNKRERKTYYFGVRMHKRDTYSLARHDAESRRNYYFGRRIRHWLLSGYLFTDEADNKKVLHIWSKETYLLN